MTALNYHTQLVLTFHSADVWQERLNCFWWSPGCSRVLSRSDCVIIWGLINVQFSVQAGQHSQRPPTNCSHRHTVTQTLLPVAWLKLWLKKGFPQRQDPPPPKRMLQQGYVSTSVAACSRADMLTSPIITLLPSRQALCVCYHACNKDTCAYITLYTAEQWIT